MWWKYWLEERKRKVFSDGWSRSIIEECTTRSNCHPDTGLKLELLQRRFEKSIRLMEEHL